MDVIVAGVRELMEEAARSQQVRLPPRPQYEPCIAGHRVLHLLRSHDEEELEAAEPVRTQVPQPVH